MFYECRLLLEKLNSFDRNVRKAEYVNSVTNVASVYQMNIKYCTGCPRVNRYQVGHLVPPCD